MITFTAFILALFIDDTSAAVLPIGEFPDNASCSAALKHLVYDGVCVEPFYIETVPAEEIEE